MKNIILLITDTFRFDNLYDRAERPIRTPHLDRFADEKATELTRFITGSFPTIPHRTDVIAGRTGWPLYGWAPLKSTNSTNLVAGLAGKGYATQLICDCPHFFNAGFQHTFQAAFQHRGQEGDKPLLHLNDPIQSEQPADTTRLRPMWNGHTLVDQHRWTNRYPQYEDESFCARTSATVSRFLEENHKAGPFFLWVDLFDPHEPWDPPEYLVKRYQKDYEGAPMMHPNYGLASAYTEEQLVNLWAHYAAEAELVDRALGRILQKLEDLETWDDSVVAITSDHGCFLGEHNRTGKTNISEEDKRNWPLYPEVSHVPFLIAAPGVKGGAKSDAFAQPVDILPTMMDLAGVDLEAPAGRSFTDVLTGTATTHRDAVMAATHLKTEALPEKATTPFFYFEHWGYSPAGSDGTPELYDLSDDPRCLTSLAESQTDVMGELKERFLGYLSGLEGGEGLAEFWTKQLT